MPFTDGYLSRMAYGIGLPLDLHEDLFQEIRVFLWQHPEAKAYQVRSRSIDFVRREGPHSRTYVRATNGLTEAQWIPARDFTEVSDRIVDYQAAWKLLNPQARRAISHAYLGAPNTAYARACRLRARKLAA